MTTKHLRRLSAVLLALLATTACADRDRTGTIDSELARDLALANQTAPQPQFRDTIVGPAPQQEVTPQAQPVRPRRTAQRISPPPAREPERTQPKPDVRVAEDPQPQEPARAPAQIVSEIGAGSSMSLSSTARVCTQTNRPGDKFIATVTSPAYGTNGAEIPAGTRVVLEVAEVNAGDTPENALITFRIRSVVLEDRDVPASGDVVPAAPLERTKVAKADPNADKKKVIGGAIAGAILGQMIGKNTKGTVIGAAAGAAAGAAVAKSGEQHQACLPDGAPLRLTLSEPLVLARR